MSRIAARFAKLKAGKPANPLIGAPATDNEARPAIRLLCRLDGIIPTLSNDNLPVMNFCGRGDQDVFAVAERLGVKL